MDSEKDIKTSSELSQKDKNSNKMSLYQKDTFFTYLFKKTEKIATAVYMVTDFFPSEEPLRKRLREIALKLLSKKISLAYGDIVQKENVAKEVPPLFTELVSLLEIAHFSNLLSSMNHLILKKEIEALGLNFENDEISKRYNKTSLFDHSFFQNSEDSLHALSAPLSLAQNDLGQQVKIHKKENMAEERVAHKGHSKGQVFIKDNKKGLQNKTLRQERILALFQKNKNDEFTIKDIVMEVKDCSEKTIQRELLLMVEKGILKKEGERRWSKYFLN